MNYQFLNKNLNTNDLVLPNSANIDSFLIKNNKKEILKALNFVNSENKFLYLHGFLGTGKRQFINYIKEFIDKNVIKLEYYCKESTVCDDILLNFNNIIENLNSTKIINTKITTLAIKFQQYISSIKKPFIIIIHSLDDVKDENFNLIENVLFKVAKENNVKLIISTKGINQKLTEYLEDDCNILLKGFSKEIFEEFLQSYKIKTSPQVIDDFYKYTRGYYYYTILTIKIIQAMQITLNEFLQKFNQSNTSFDSFLSLTYINLIPTTIRNFFWFLRTIRHGITLNALAVYELYDEFSIEYLKTNMIIFLANETLYVQDYFLQDIDISIPTKTQIKLHKYIKKIYEEQLKTQIKDRLFLISRQALRAEIEYHNNSIKTLENNFNTASSTPKINTKPISQEKTNNTSPQITLNTKIENIKNLKKDKKYTEAIECIQNIIETEKIDLQILTELRLELARLYKTISNYKMATHYYDLIETYYKHHKEYINLNYLYYDLTDLYFKLYKNDRAIETIKKVIYSVDTPQSLLVNSCILLGNIYIELKNTEDAYIYYKKAIDSIDETVEKDLLAELYFKFGLVNDDKNLQSEAIEYYNKCITLGNTDYTALAYYNIASCYYDNDNYDDALSCFYKAYKIEKSNNNFDGLYYTSKNIAKILFETNEKEAYKFLIEAKKSAEIINDDFYIIESLVAMGDYYYNNKQTYKEALEEYLKAKNLAEKYTNELDIQKIETRINDMKIRINNTDYKEIENKYEHKTQ